LPLDVQDDANRVLSAATVTMLTNYGDFSLDEIETVVASLPEFGVAFDKDAAAAAANAALEDHIKHLSSTLYGLGSVEDLHSVLCVWGN
jgi:hypothetical protein